MTENVTPAPAEASAAPVEAPTTASLEPTTPAAAPAATPEQQPYFSNEQLAEMQKFVESNGGYDKAWGTFKQKISNPAPAPEPAQEPAPVAQQPVQQPAQPQTVATPEGYITQEEFAAKQYFNALASEEQYSAISDKIKSGEMLREMTAFGIKPTMNGAFNDQQIRRFFDLYAKTVPATQPAAEPTSTPTADYVQIDAVNSVSDALNIIQNNVSLKAQGKPEHSMTEQAKEFLRKNGLK